MSDAIYLAIAVASIVIAPAVVAIVVGEGLDGYPARPTKRSKSTATQQKTTHCTNGDSAPKA